MPNLTSFIILNESIFLNGSLVKCIELWIPTQNIEIQWRCFVEWSDTKSSLVFLFAGPFSLPVLLDPMPSGFVGCPGSPRASSLQTQDREVGRIFVLDRRHRQVRKDTIIAFRKTLRLDFKGHELKGSLVKILAKIGVRSYRILVKHFQIRVKLSSWFRLACVESKKPSHIKLKITEVNAILMKMAWKLRKVTQVKVQVKVYSLFNS